MNRLRRLSDTLTGADPRTLGLVRVALAVSLLADLALRAADSGLWYAHDGLLPPAAALAVAPAPSSFFFGLVEPWLVGAAFAACAVCYAALLVGFRSSLAGVASLVCLLALHARTDLITTAGDHALVLLAWTTVLLPLGRRLSVDAVAADLSRRREATAEALAETAAIPRDDAPVRSLWVLALLAQITAFWAAQLIRTDSLPLRVILAAAAVGLLAPLGAPWTRRIVMLLGGGAHLVLASAHGDLGLLLIGLPYLLLLVSGADWAALARRARARPIVVHFDDDCGICFAAARLLVRLDLFGRIEPVPISAARDLPPGFDPGRLADTMLVVEAGTGRGFVRSAAVARVVAALPLGGASAWFLRVPGISGLADGLYDRLARNRAVVSAYLGWAACGSGAMGGTTLVTEPSVAREWLGEHLERVREVVAVGALLLLAVAASPGGSVASSWAVSVARQARLEPRRAVSPRDPPAGRLEIAADAAPRDVAAALGTLARAPRYGIYAARLPEATAYHEPLATWLSRELPSARRIGAVVISADGSREPLVDATR